MHRTLLNFSASVVVFAMSGCMSVPFVQTVDGREAHLSSDDISHLNHLIAHRPDIKKPLAIVVLDGPDHADCTGGPAYENFAPITGFKAYKKNGKWFLDERSVYQTTAGVTS
jgi:hypothetical protein